MGVLVTREGKSKSGLSLPRREGGDLLLNRRSEKEINTTNLKKMDLIHWYHLERCFATLGPLLPS